MLLLVPTCLVFELSRVGLRPTLRNLRLALALGAPPAIYALVHLAFPPVNRGWSAWLEVRTVLALKWQPSTLWPGHLRQVWEFPFSGLIVWGLVGGLAFAGLWGSLRRRAREDAWMAVALGLTLVSSFVGSYDDSRSQTYGLPCVLFFAARGLSDHRALLAPPWAYGTLLAAQLWISDLFLPGPRDFASFMPHYMGPARATWWLARLGLAAGLAFAVIALRLRGPRPLRE